MMPRYRSSGFGGSDETSAGALALDTQTTTAVEDTTYAENVEAERTKSVNNLCSTDRVLVTGGTGSLGQALIPRILASGATLRVLSRDEVKQGELARVYGDQVELCLGDVRDLRACKRAMQTMTIVLHCASLKYVDVSELQPTEYILTNVLGTINVIQAVEESDVHTLIGISTDKAAGPINTYGLTKGLLEKLFMEAHSKHAGRFGPGTRFIVCRYGNVLASRGSVVLKWAVARQRGEALQVTDPDMTRFFFTLDDAMDLIDHALMQSSGIIVSKAMPSTTLGELAKVMAGPEGIRVIGRRQGEKAHEDLLTAQEMQRVVRMDDIFYYSPLVGPHRGETEAYTSFSARRLTTDELLTLTAPWR